MRFSTLLFWVSFLTFISGTMPGGRRRKLKGLDFVVFVGICLLSGHQTVVIGQEKAKGS